MQQSADDYGFAWYDSHWLHIYCEARAIVADRAPDRLADFEHSFDRLRCKPDFRTIFLPNFLTAERRQVLCDEITNITDNQLEKDELLSFGRLVVHNQPLFNELQTELTDYVSEICDQPLEPCYNFLALYNNLGVCRPHLDAPSACWTVDICLDQSAIWPIHISEPVPWPDSPNNEEDLQAALLRDDQIKFHEVRMQPGDAAVFTGPNQWHYRDRIGRSSLQNFCHLLFLHYVPRGIKPLLNPLSWSERLGIPELEEQASHLRNLLESSPKISEEFFY